MFSSLQQPAENKVLDARFLGCRDHVAARLYLVGHFHLRNQDLAIIDLRGDGNNTISISKRRA